MKKAKHAAAVLLLLSAMLASCAQDPGTAETAETAAEYAAAHIAAAQKDSFEKWAQYGNKDFYDFCEKFGLDYETETAAALAAMGEK